MSHFNVDQFIDVLEYSQNISVKPFVIHSMLEKWFQQKKFFLDQWNGVTFETGEITIDTSPEIQRKEFKDFIHYVKIRIVSGNTALEIAQLRESFYDFMYSLSLEDFYGNCVSQGFTDEMINLKIQKGTRLSRVLKHFISETNTLNDIQMYYSRILQQKTITGVLCLSVDPLDFLTMSETGYNWRSCQSLDGSYRVGTMSLMMDSCTFIAYLKATENTQLSKLPPETPWNNKRWRMLCHWNQKEKVLVMAKAYPYSNSDIENNVLNAITDSFKVENKESSSLFQIPYDVVMEDDDLGLHYNDSLTRENNGSKMFKFKGIPSSNDEKMVVGGAVTCLECGNNLLVEPSMFICEECAELYRCDSCGDLTDQYSIYETMDSFLCETCYFEKCYTCDGCGEIFDQDEGGEDCINEYGFCKSCEKG